MYRQILDKSSNIRNHYIIQVFIRSKELNKSNFKLLAFNKKIIPPLLQEIILKKKRRFLVKYFLKMIFKSFHKAVKSSIYFNEKNPIFINI